MGKRLHWRGVADAERAAVLRLAHSRTAPARAVERAVERARVVLAALDGATMVGRLQVARTTVSRWRHRVDELGLAGLEDSRGWRIAPMGDARGRLPASRSVGSWPPR